MIMRVDGGLRKIYLGPKWFVVRQEVRIMPGDPITATILAPNNLSAVAYAESVATRNGTLRFRNAVLTIAQGIRNSLASGEAA